jgi:hypothetical protein
MLLLLVAVGGGVLATLVWYEPADYQHCALPPGQQRQKHSQEFQAKFTHLLSAIGSEPEWEETFTEAQINSYLDEDFMRSGIGERMLPEEIREPRVSIAPDKVRLAFRYGSDSWCSTIISVDFSVWLPRQEQNVVALEVQALHAGALPITAQSLLDRVSEVARQRDIDVPWFRHNGHPVALLRFQANQPRPTIRLERLELREGELIVRGRSLDAAPVRAMLSKPTISLAPSGN